LGYNLRDKYAASQGNGTFYGGTMFRLSKLSLTILSIYMVTALSACNLGQAAAPTATPLDINAISTNVVATVNAQNTANAPTAAPSATITIAPSETLAGVAATNTQGIVPIEETSTSAFGVVATATTIFGFTATPNGTVTAIPSFTPVFSISTPSGPVCKNSAFDGDVTIPDGTEMKAWEKFEKIWAVKNTGTCRWDEGFYFAAISGPPSMGANQGAHKFKTADRFVEAGATVLISIDMYAPGDPGEYVAHWHMFDDNSQPFGGDFVVVIKVVK
jgi:Ig-like domain from next to BRCA1 gene